MDKNYIYLYQLQDDTPCESVISTPQATPVPSPPPSSSRAVIKTPDCSVGGMVSLVEQTLLVDDDGEGSITEAGKFWQLYEFD